MRRINAFPSKGRLDFGPKKSYIDLALQSNAWALTFAGNLSAKTSNNENSLF